MTFLANQLDLKFYKKVSIKIWLEWDLLKKSCSNESWTNVKTNEKNKISQLSIFQWWQIEN